jgi:hypothetical protein
MAWLLIAHGPKWKFATVKICGEHHGARASAPDGHNAGGFTKALQ